MTNTHPASRPDTAVSVRLEGINLSFGKTHVLKGIDLQIEPGEFFAFLGPSGCGKTTLLRLIAGFESAQTGGCSSGTRKCPIYRHGSVIWAWFSKVTPYGRT